MSTSSPVATCRKLQPFDFAQQSLGLATIVATALFVSAIILTAGSTVIPFSLLLKSYGIGLFLVHFPHAVHALVGNRCPWGIGWIVCLVAVAAAGFACPADFRTSLCWLLSVTGIASTLAFSRNWGRELIQSRKNLLTVGCASLIVAGYLVGQAWGVYRNPLVLQAVAAGRSPHHMDPWFQAQLVGTIQTYGMPSAGYDGVTYLPYHHAVHFFLAGVGNLLRVSPILVISVAFPLVLMPSYLRLWEQAASALRLMLKVKASESSRREFCLFWVTTTVAHAQFLPPSFQQPFFLYDSLFQSESFALSIMLLFALTSAVAQCTPQSLVSIFLTAAFASAMITWSKFPVVHLLLGLAFYYCIRVPRMVSRLSVAAVFVGGLLGYLVCQRFIVTPLPGGLLKFQGFGFWRQYLNEDTRLIYPFAATIWGILFFFMYLRIRNISTIAEFQENLKERELLPAETTLVIALLSLMPGCVLGGPMSFNVMYYVETTRLIFGMGVAVLIESLVVAVPAHLSLARVAGRLGAALALMLALQNIGGTLVSTMTSNLEYRGDLFLTPPGAVGTPKSPTMGDCIRSGRPWEIPQRLLKNLQAVDAAILSDRSPTRLLLDSINWQADVRKQTLLYCPTPEEFWKTQSGANKCEPIYLPMVPIGISGLALLEGVPHSPAQGALPHYAVSLYPPRSSAQLEIHSDSMLLQQAQKRGFRRVAVLAVDSSGKPELRVLDAANDAQ